MAGPQRPETCNCQLVDSALDDDSYMPYLQSITSACLLFPLLSLRAHQLVAALLTESMIGPGVSRASRYLLVSPLLIDGGRFSSRNSKRERMLDPELPELPIRAGHAVATYLVAARMCARVRCNSVLSCWISRAVAECGMLSDM